MIMACFIRLMLIYKLNLGALGTEINQKQTWLYPAKCFGINRIFW